MAGTAELRRCARCGHLTRADRMVKGYGRDCATQLGLIGSSVDIGHEGPDLLDVLAGSTPTKPLPRPEPEPEPEPEDECDGWDHESRPIARA